ncbi:MAG: signal peptidase II [Beijerinckiaceae bacterium]
MTASRSLLLWIAGLTFVLDQASKLYLYFVVDIAAAQPIRLAPFLEFILVWNRGISYGLFQQESDVGRWLLVAFSLAAAVGLGIWAWRSGEKLLSAALALIVGGALGNAVDRVLYGAVLDFVHVFAGTFSWYVFNIADAAIVVGVGILLYDSLRSRGGTAPEKP